ncbi:MAG: D-alanyl-D-alanine carboxypeptidase, partial [Oscillospiraceae bacterium]|nr:D-alanyl-D-alanine carboxypeptidase [Oscillospiraceae bacterium]
MVNIGQVVDLLKKGILVLAFTLLCGAVAVSRAFALEEGDISAKAAVLYCPDTGEVLFAKNKDMRLPMASTTKIMTSLLAIESNTPDLNVIVSEQMVSVEGSSMGLLPGDSVTLRNLIYGMLLESGNDAATVTAYVLGDTLQGFAGMMNAKAKEIGMQNTNFITPSGLDAEEHYSTAYDMALLAAYAVDNPEFAAACSLKSIRVDYGNPPYMRTLSNHNRLLDSYEGCFGIKTGFTKKSGRCLVSAAKRDGVTLVCVTLNAPNDWADHQKLFDYGFETVKSADLPVEDTLSLSVVGGKASSVRVEGAYSPKVVFSDSLPEVQNEIFLKPFEYAPVKKGQVLGSVVYR